MWFDQEATRVRAGRTSNRGNPDDTILNWAPGAVSRLVLPALNIQPASQTETGDAERTAVTTGWRVQSDEGVDLDVTALDRIEWNSTVFEVQGEIARWPDPIAGGVHHVEFTIVRVTG
ncbi:hypothetical protein ACFQ61_10060 [Streptomyces sp. NPDC056500]|uniref:hypothetical protein n=1 Tax=Streptomyces sp. NPDC056500 TaxID=3345840 RepID=UPI00367A7D83